MKISVILSTYNSPEALEKSVWGYLCQDFRDFELVIADDGSGHETKTCIESLRQQTDLRIRHVWHEDKGFRKCEILNRAILEARHPYLVFSDGDCIPRPDFLAVHASRRRPGHFLSGGYTCLKREASRELSKDTIRSGHCFKRSWIGDRALKNRPFSKHSTPRWLAPVFNRLTPTTQSWNGHNASAWKQDILAVNGFDERMKYGGEDREFGIRLRNYGIRPIQIRYSAICLHLDHDRPYVDQNEIRFHHELREASSKNGSVWTAFGIRKTDSPSG